MTKTQTFQADESKKETLRQALPVVLEALEAIKDGLESNRTNMGLTDPNIGNGCFQQIVGARHLIAELPKMTKEAPTAKPLEGRRQFTEADRETLEKKREEAK